MDSMDYTTLLNLLRRLEQSDPDTVDFTNEYASENEAVENERLDIAVELRRGLMELGVFFGPP